MRNSCAVSSTRRTRSCGALFPLYHSPNNLSIGKINKNQYQNSPEFVQHYLLTFGAVCGILLVSRGETRQSHHHKVGIPQAKAKRQSSASSQKKCKKPLTNPLKYDIIRVQSGDATGEPQQSRNATHLTPLEWTMVERPREPHKTVN